MDQNLLDLLKKHYWHFQYDEGNLYRKGLAEREKIVNSLALVDFEQYAGHIPEEYRETYRKLVENRKNCG
jgi:hypothetical protein